jgi:hypothetical protein
MQISSRLRRVKTVGGSSGVSGKLLTKKSTIAPNNYYKYESDTLVEFEAEEQETTEGSLFNVFENI